MEHLSREQLLAVLAKAKASSRRDWVLLLVTFWHGLRASEALSLTPQHFTDGYLTIQRLKGSMRTTQPLVEDPEPLLDERTALQAWLARHVALYGHDGGARLFPLNRFQFYRMVRRYGRAAGLPKHLCHPHIFKHTIAALAIREAGIENVRQYLGHRSISSTGEYLKVSDAAASSAIAAAATRGKPHNS